MSTRVIPLAQLVPCPPEHNPNKMSPEKFELLKAAMANPPDGSVEDVLQPPLIAPLPDGFFDVVDGSHRVRAATALGWVSMECVVRVMSPEQVRAYRLGMNNQRGDIDLAIAQLDLAELIMEGWSPEQLGVTGFTADEIADLTRVDDPNDRPTARVDVDDGDAQRVEKPFVLEIPFRTRDAYKRARKAVLKAAGKGKELDVGLLRLIGEES
jgi:ParB-like chromosome segregation protein Spo0J